jgi:hypothetical protein
MAEQTKIFSCYSGRWGAFDFTKRVDRIRYSLCMIWERVERKPTLIKWRLADLLSSFANRLRGHKVFDLGYGLKGNRAAQLKDESLFIISAANYRKIDQDEVEELQCKIAELGQLASQTWWHTN